MIKVEGFYRKYKYIILGLLAFVVLFAIVTKTYGYIQEQTAISNSNLYTNLLLTNDSNIKAELQKNSPKLYALYSFQKAMKDNDIEALQAFQGDNALLGSIAKYQIASAKGDIDSIKNYSTDSKAALKDFAFLQEAYLLMKNNKTEEAKVVLSMIGLESPLKNVADFLIHFSAKGSK